MNPAVPAQPTTRKDGSWWPLVIVVVAVGVLQQSSIGEPVRNSNTHLAIFSSRSIAFDNADLRDESVIAFFGTTRLDYRHALLAGATPRITALAVFGTVEILLPRNCRLSGDTLAVLGDFDNQASTADSENPVALAMDGAAFLGKVVISN